MTNALANGEVTGGWGQDAGGDGDGAPDAAEVGEAISFASFALSALGFMTLLRLADRRDRSPVKALGLFMATTLESTTGTVLGAMAVSRHREANGLSRGLLVGAAGTVLGIITTALNFNWMRTKRRL
jgi:hypothetical protein